jgi:solute carrier family 8 (sodium/calcium exchanger)
MAGGGPLICEPGGGGLFLPLFGDAEQHWNPHLRAGLYLAGLLYTFLGVAIVADIFMAAIERVTSKTRPVTHVNKDGVTKTYQVQVWNGTVANLTLMALGSSAPEILLAVIEVTTNNFYSGDLGPSTIVGSAAYNLMIILALCVMVIPAGESRSIDQYNVFLTTSFFSVLAYLWLVYIVTLAEGAITFFLFPLLVLLAYLVDVGYFSRKPANAHGYVIGLSGGQIPEKEMTKMIAEIKGKYPNEEISKEARARARRQEARAWGGVGRSGAAPASGSGDTPAPPRAWRAASPRARAGSQERARARAGGSLGSSRAAALWRGPAARCLRALVCARVAHGVHGRALQPLALSHRARAWPQLARRAPPPARRARLGFPAGARRDGRARGEPAAAQVADVLADQRHAPDGRRQARDPARRCQARRGERRLARAARAEPGRRQGRGRREQKGRLLHHLLGGRQVLGLRGREPRRRDHPARGRAEPRDPGQVQDV